MTMSTDPVRKMNTTLRAITQNKYSSSNLKSLLESGSYTGTGFRSGSINDIIAHDSCEFKHAVMITQILVQC